MAHQSDYRSRQGRGYIADLVYETPAYGEGGDHAEDISLSSDAYGHENWYEGRNRREETERPDTSRYNNTHGRHPSGDVRYAERPEALPSGNTAAPHAGRGPKGYKGRSSDDHLWEHVCQALTDDSHVNAEDISVEVQDGEVTLTGTVDSRRTKRLAEDIACSLRGVHDVHNRLRLRNNTDR